MYLPTKITMSLLKGSVIALCVATSPSVTLAQTVELQPRQTKTSHKEVDFSGKWRLAVSAEQNRQRIQAIKDATSTFGRFKQARARQVMEKMTAPVSELTISDEGNQIRLSQAGFEFTVATDQRPVTIKTPDGTATVSSVKRGEKLVIEFKKKDSTKTVVYHLSGDGEVMQQQVEISTSRLSKPLRFASNYRR